MELSTSRIISNPTFRLGLMIIPPTNLPFTHSAPLNRSRFFVPISDSISYRRRSVRASPSDEFTREPSKLDGERTIFTLSVEDFPPPPPSPVEKDAFPEPFEGEAAEKDSLIGEQVRPVFEVLEKYNIKFDSEEPYSLLLYGTGSLVALWLLSAIVGAIDSIPLVPKLMEVVGLSYSLWFTTRYLIFKKDRDELGAKIEELKKQVFGIDDN